MIAPGSVAAYEDSLPASLVEEALHDQAEWLRSIASRPAPITVAATFTRAALSGPVMFAAACWLAALCFARRRCGMLLLLATAVAGGGFAFFGLADGLRLSRDSEVELRQRLIISPVGADDPFGPFVNNNTGAGYLNLAIGCAVGVLVFAVRRNQAKRNPNRAWRIERLQDWRIVAIVLLIGVMIAGVMGSQSRGGFLGMAVGFTVLGCFHLRGRAMFVPLMAGMIVLGAAWTFLGSLGMQEQTGQRLKTLTDGGALEDPRLSHWQDGWNAGQHYLVTGAGIGSYRFAYLPYQRLSGPRWFVNADGMHIEWWVEGGIWLLPVVVIGVLGLIRQLQQISRHSPTRSCDAIRSNAILDSTAPNSTNPDSTAPDNSIPDDACYTSAMLSAMTFVLPSLLVTQSFDFGILQPPLLLTFAVLCGAISELASRQATLRPGTTTPRVSPTRWHSSRSLQTILTIAVVGILSVGLMVAASDLRDAAAVERVGTLHDRHTQRNASDLPDFEDAIRSMQQVVARSPYHSEAHLVLARVMMAQQRRLGAMYLVDQQNFAAKEATRWVSPRNVRRAYYSGNNADRLGIASFILPPQSLGTWIEARKHALAALLLCPLDDRARIMLIELDMLDNHAGAASPELLSQAATLRCRNPRTLRQLEQLAKVHPGDTHKYPIRTKPENLSVASE